jgi:glycosyltransferase involved in cell wall biosynthesis
MNILHILTQKPNSTGSATYMCATIKGFKGHNQAIVAGIDKNDIVDFQVENVKFYPVLYNTKDLPFDVVGMSDIMPYPSTKYRDLNETKVNQLKEEFKKVIKRAIDEFKPDVIISHHLYLLTSFVREIVDDIKVIGICHGTCLKQLLSHDLERDYIISNIAKLDKIVALHNEQKKDIIDIFGVDDNLVEVLGCGYDEEIFFRNSSNLGLEKIIITYAGKIAKIKGVESLIKALNKLKFDKNLIEVNIVGDGSDEEEYKQIYDLAMKSKYKINFLGKLSQTKLASLLRQSHLFVLASFAEGLPLVVIEALASGCNVVTTDILGVKEWMGDVINDSSKINYVKLPKMKDLTTPFEDDLENFETNLSNSLNDMIMKIINDDSRNKNVDMIDKTWRGLCKKLENII